MKFFFHDLEIFISKEKCWNISGSEMCVVKYYSVCSHNQVSLYDHHNVSFIKRIFIFLVIDIAVLNHAWKYWKSARNYVVSDWGKIRWRR